MLLALSSAATATFAQDNLSICRTFSSGFRFVEMTGEELFANVCQGCHMPDAAGATGAGLSIAGRQPESRGERLCRSISSLNGRRGMPAFGAMMTDGQVAAVVNYLRTHFGNNYQDAVSPEEVKQTFAAESITSKQGEPT